MNNTMSKREQKRQTILDMARKIFSRFGLNKTTMDEIAKATRMGKATLYHYFSSKEQIFAEVIKEESRILKDKLNDALENAKTPQEKLRSYIITRIKYLNVLANTYSALSDDYLEHYSSVKKFRQEFSENELQTLAALLRYGVDKKVFSVMKINDVANVMVMALRGLEFALFTSEESEVSDDDINLLTDIMLYGICK
ncbi:MAG: TetR/AcrR family transcriptional regulator [Candidatus Neomarinimicrobiota bacterium]|nr:MAG: TetR/AcrR family transcriptional regulator [Candidatus Neomarinimicrobiota bacterium]